MADMLTLDQGIDALVNGGDPAPVQPAQQQPDPQESAADIEHDAGESQSGASPEDVQPGLSQESPDLQASEEDAPDDGEPDSEETAEESEESQDDPVFAFKADGADVEMSASELIRAYQSRQGLDKAKGEVDRQRNELERELAETARERAAMQAKREKYIESIDAAMQRMGSVDEIKDPDPALQQTDPYEYNRLALQAIQQREQMREIERTRQREFEEHQADVQKQYGDRIAQENTQLLEKLPEWKDPSIRQQEESAMFQFAIDQFGFTPEDVSRTIDHRTYLLVREAWKAHAGQTGAKKAVAKKVAKAAPVIRSGQRVKTKSKTGVQKADDVFVTANQRAAKGDPMADALGAAVDLVVQRQNARAQR